MKAPEYLKLIAAKVANDTATTADLEKLSADDRAYVRDCLKNTYNINCNIEHK